MSDINSCDFLGRLGRDPEIRVLPNGGKVANFSMACGDKWKDKNTGELKERTEWVRITAFGPLAEKVIARYVKKGSRVFVKGAECRTRKWEKDGVDQYSTEFHITMKSQFVMLDGKPDGGGQSAPQQQAAPDPQKPAESFDDDVPF